jgi:hypothetical protein
MNRIEWVRQSVEQHLSDIHDLLAMRLLFPPEHSVVTIEKEILDLYLYPERLETSYRDEWQAIALKALYQHGFADHWRTDQDNLDAYLGLLREQRIPRCIHDHLNLFHTLEEILAIKNAGNTLTFPDPRRQALMRLIWPDE